LPLKSGTMRIVSSHANLFVGEEGIRKIIHVPDYVWLEPIKDGLENCVGMLDGSIERLSGGDRVAAGVYSG
jgi:hypothetical protein